MRLGCCEEVVDDGRCICLGCIMRACACFTLPFARDTRRCQKLAAFELGHLEMCLTVHFDLLFAREESA